MAYTSLLSALAFFAVLACCSGQFLTCGFRHSCDGFITSIDNVFNTDTDVPWTRVSRLQTSNFRAKVGDTFLSIYQDAAEANSTWSPPRVTSRLVIPAPTHETTQGCLRLRYTLTNGTMTIRHFETDATRTVTNSSSAVQVNGIDQSYLWLTPDTNRTLLEVELARGLRSEFGLDSVRMYDEKCDDVADFDDGVDPTWPPLTTTTTAAPSKGAHEVTTADPGGAAGGVRAATALVILMLLVTLLVGPHALR